MALEPILSLRRALFAVSRSHTDTHKNTHPVALLWMNDQAVIEVATYAIHKAGNV